ncbi:MAG TPA: hypothetical protein VK853_05645, partial [Ilumatobacteraceae bacterium]|nr:hypothetical protein [Ilumatobacteraceae bacterium]
ASLLPAIFLLLDNPQRSWSSTTDSPTNAVYRPQDWFVVVLALTSIGATVVATAGARALARAPIPADTPDRLAVRHAIRSAAIMALIGASVMVSGAVGAKLAGSAVLLDGDAPQVVRWVNNLAYFGSALGTLFGAMWTVTTIPRLGLFAGHLSPVPAPETPSAT